MDNSEVVNSEQFVQCKAKLDIFDLAHLPWMAMVEIHEVGFPTNEMEDFRATVAQVNVSFIFSINSGAAMPSSK